MIAKDKTVLRFILLYLLLSVFVFSSVATAEDSFISDPDAVEDVADSVFMLEVYDRSGSRVAIGSGFVAFESDLLVTNFHVIEEGEYVVAISDDSQRYVLNQVCVYSQAIDLAILHFSDHMNTKPLELDTESTLKRSQTVMAIGSPAGLRNTISIGNISAFFDQDGRDWIQFTAPISPGSSGGVLLNDQGKVIGITTATYGSTQNVNLAIRASKLQELYARWDRKTTVSFASIVRKYSDPTRQKDKGVSPYDQDVVWITKTGKKYHSNPTCSGMRSPIEISLNEAIQQGYEPCGKCFK